MPFPSVSHQHLRFTLGILFFVNITLYIGLAILFILNGYFQIPLLTYLQSLVALLIIFPATGLNLTALVEFFTRQKFTRLEKIFLATLISLIVPALVLSILYTTFSLYSPLLTVALCITYFIAAFLLHPQFLDSHTEERLPKNLWLTFGLSGVFYVGIFIFITRSFYALPDLDPYYWLRLFQDEFTASSLTGFSAHRPLFSSFSYLFYATASVDFYAYFKYVLPSLFLILLFPLTLIAKNFKSTLNQLLVFSIPFITASFFLYTTTPIPQAILNIGIILFSICLLHSYITHNNFYFITGGIFILFLTFFHELAIIFFLIWFFTALFYFRVFLKKTYHANPVLITAILLLSLAHLIKLFQGALGFICLWVKSLFLLLLNSAPNFGYPTTYINIDGNAVGWGTPLGVLKYYIFYTGGIFWLLVIFALVYLFQKRNTLVREKELFVIGISLTFFFILAEILPRFFNIAMLPERAWGFVALFSYCLFLIFLYKVQQFRYSREFLILCLIVFGIHIYGALYINNLKQHLITPHQIESAEWIKINLPNDRIIFTHNNESLLRAHSQSAFLNTANPEFYTDIRIFEELLRKNRLNSLDIRSRYTDYIHKLQTTQLRLESYDPAKEKEFLIAETESFRKVTREFLEYVKQEASQADSDKNVYIYFAKPSDLNPYSKRPYVTQQSNDVAEFIFDKNPSRFKRVYATPNNEVIIWQYIP